MVQTEYTFPSSVSVSYVCSTPRSLAQLSVWDRADALKQQRTFSFNDLIFP